MSVLLELLGLRLHLRSSDQSVFCPDDDAVSTAEKECELECEFCVCASAVHHSDVGCTIQAGTGCLSCSLGHCL